MLGTLKCIYLFELELFFFSDKCPGLGLLDHIVTLFLVFCFVFFFNEPQYCFLQWLHQFTFSPTVHKGSLFSTTCSTFIVCRLFDDSHSNQCEVIFHYSFDLYFSNNKRCLAPLHVFVSHLYVFFGEMSVQVFLPLFDWVVCFSGIKLYELLIYFGN